MLSVPNLLGYLVTRSKALPLGIQPVRLHTSYHNAGVLLEMVKAFIPPLLSSAHKGECGRIGVVGGCQEYTGAPYFAAISALKLGADLSHVFCTKEAAPVIKSYSPELIVHPLLDSSNCAKEIEEWLPRLHAIVLGPGLGRSVGVLENACSVIQQAKERGLPLVVDADGLFLVTQDPQIITGYEYAILTPNVAEFARLYEKVMGEQPVKSEPISCVKSLCSKLGNVTIVHKGEADIISNGKEVLVCTSEGSARRCGGQGDLLSGSMGTFVYWALRVYNNNQGINKNLSVYGPCVSGAYAACLLTRECNRRAFMKHRRSMTTSDMITVLQEAFEAIYE